MSDYIERQKVKDIRFSGGINHDGFLYVPYKELVDGIKALPSADVVQVVRCRKCKYFWTYRCMDSMPIETCELAQTFYNPDLDFCSLAKRREE
jgi:hypothetical protein